MATILFLWAKIAVFSCNGNVLQNYGFVKVKVDILWTIES